MRVIGDKNLIFEDVFDFMISYLPFPQKSICSELAKLFSISIEKSGEQDQKCSYEWLVNTDPGVSLFESNTKF